LEHFKGPKSFLNPFQNSEFLDKSPLLDWARLAAVEAFVEALVYG